ncbi:MAG: peroxidase-related enzyme [Phycisphaerales bacterium]|nr:peroxidase-related enzyme [Phycisphaerales bacterium]
MESHEPDLRSEVKDDEKVRSIQSDYRDVDLGAATRALLDFATKLTRAPQEMMRTDIEALRSAGFSDEDIVDAAQLAGYFNYSNRVMDSLGIEPESEMRFQPTP